MVVEGYTDCVTAHQYGVDNVVGTLGTALTDEHVTALKRMSSEWCLSTMVTRRARWPLRGPFPVFSPRMSTCGS
ncbi:MAG: hypothetical protein CM1200mP2_48660 [Planctomycetaceae bacterium]|nr:MAG: hypothetical protein CM1200mP2_48660 [Planctomycetaceae bacterium]